MLVLFKSYTPTHRHTHKGSSCLKAIIWPRHLSLSHLHVSLNLFYFLIFLLFIPLKYIKNKITLHTIDFCGIIIFTICGRQWYVHIIIDFRITGKLGHRPWATTFSTPPLNNLEKHSCIKVYIQCFKVLYYFSYSHIYII